MNFPPPWVLWCELMRSAAGAAQFLLFSFNKKGGERAVAAFEDVHKDRKRFAGIAWFFSEWVRERAVCASTEP